MSIFEYDQEAHMELIREERSEECRRKLNQLIH